MQDMKTVVVFTILVVLIALISGIGGYIVGLHSESTNQYEKGYLLGSARGFENGKCGTYCTYNKALSCFNYVPLKLDRYWVYPKEPRVIIDNGFDDPIIIEDCDFSGYEMSDGQTDVICDGMDN